MRDTQPTTIPVDMKRMQVIPRWEMGAVTLFIEYKNGDTTHSSWCYSIIFEADLSITYNEM